MTHEALLHRIERLERTLRWRTRLFATCGTAALLAAATGSQPESLVIGKPGGPTVVIENGKLQLADVSGHRAELSAEELHLASAAEATTVRADGVDVTSRTEDFWTASTVRLSPTGLRVSSSDGEVKVGKSFLGVSMSGGSAQLSVAQAGTQGRAAGTATFSLESGPRRAGSVIELEATPDQQPEVRLAPSAKGPRTVLSTDGKISRATPKPAR